MVCEAAGGCPADALRFISPQLALKKLNGQTPPYPHPPFCRMGPSGRHALGCAQTCSGELNGKGVSASQTYR